MIQLVNNCTGDVDTLLPEVIVGLTLPQILSTILLRVFLDESYYYIQRLATT